ncbi:MAG: hypothetical protein K2Z80_31740 [Xanthobacteraceae bacterium]|nr:hypothetical protein [Xanthobacteraceae bacterium]
MRFTHRTRVVVRIDVNVEVVAAHSLLALRGDACEIVNDLANEQSART